MFGRKPTNNLKNVAKTARVKFKIRPPSTIGDSLSRVDLNPKLSPATLNQTPVRNNPVGIESINKWILNIYGNRIESNHTEISHNLQNKFPEAIDYKLIKTIGDGDCLIHAILTSISSVYRQIPYDDKNRVGSLFRREFVAPLVQDPVQKEFFLSTEYLRDEHLITLSKIFHFNYIIFQEVPENLNERSNIPEQSAKDNITYIVTEENVHWIILHNYLGSDRSGDHYSSVMLPDDSFTIDDYNEGLTTAKLLSNQQNAIINCNYNDGDIVVYNEEQYKITDRRWDDGDPPHCVSVSLLKIDDGQTIDNIPVGEIRKMDVVIDVADVAPEAPAAAPEAPAGAPAAPENRNCIQLFDPCTKEPLKDFKELEKRIRDIKKEQNILLSDKLQFPFEEIGKKRLDLLIYLLNMEKELDTSFFKYTINGQLYEAIWDIIFSFGFLLLDENGNEIFPKNKNFYMYIDNIDGETEIKNDRLIQNSIKYLDNRRINMGASGSSDITFLYLSKGEQTQENEIDNCSAPLYIKPISSCGNSQQLSELSLEKKIEKHNKIYLCSSKYFEFDEKKSVIEDYDISKIFISGKNIDLTFEKHIILLVKNKNIVEEKLKRALHTEIAEEARFVFGMAELFSAFKKLKDFVKNIHGDNKINRSNITTIFNYENKKENKILNLRLHQIMTVDKIVDAINNFKIKKTTEDSNNKFIVGILPRGGKTYIAGGIVRDLAPKIVVVLLGAWSETNDQFIKDLFDYNNSKGFLDFKDYKTITVKEEDTTFKFDENQKYIFVMSIELFKNPDYYYFLYNKLKENNTLDEIQLIELLNTNFGFNKKETAKRIYDKWIGKGKPEIRRKFLGELQGLISGHRADLFICDEAHLKQITKKGTKAVSEATKSKDDEETTEISEEELKQFIDKKINKQIPVVYMTGTYSKPLDVFKPPNENIALWTYNDIDKSKNLEENKEYFIQNFGQYYINALNKCFSYNETYESIQKIYQRFPKLKLITTHFTEEAKNAFEDQSKGKGYSTVPQLFELNDPTNFVPSNANSKRWHLELKNIKGMMRLINYLAPEDLQTKIIKINDKNEDIVPINSALESVEYIAQRYRDRLQYFTSEFKTHTQLWFLPRMNGHPLYKRMCALSGCIFQNKWFSDNFVVLAVTSSTKWDIAGSKDNRIIIINETYPNSCGVFSWIIDDDATSLKEKILIEEKRARDNGKGLIILAQNMLQLGISLTCVDIVVLLDDTQQLDERIQKMYRALTESYSASRIYKTVGFIIDMNYFRTVRALTDYQIIDTERRTGKKVPLEKINEEVRKVLRLYNIDDTGKIMRSVIENDTIPELVDRYRIGDKTIKSDVKVETAGKSMNSEINSILDKEYQQWYNDILLDVKTEKEENMRKHGTNVNPAKAQGIPNNNSNKEEKEPSKEKSGQEKVEKMFGNKLNKKEAFKDLFKTVLKLGVFGSENKNLESLKNSIENDENFRDILYNTLVERGDIVDNIKPTYLEIFAADKTVKKEITKYIKNILSNIDKLKETNKLDNIENIFNKKFNDKKTIFYKLSEENKKSLILIIVNISKQYNRLEKEDEDQLNSNLENSEELIDQDIKVQLPSVENLEIFFKNMFWQNLPESQQYIYIEKEAYYIREYEENRDFLFNKIIIPNLEKIIESNRSSYNTMKQIYNSDSEINTQFSEVLNYINEHLTPKETELHKSGEVFTPLELVDEMLSRLPQSGKDNVWNKKNLKWLDPANGIGNFPIKVLIGQQEGVYSKDGPYKGKPHFTYPGLFEGLRDEIPDDNKRTKWIIENMLYMIDINGKNNLIARKLFKKINPDAESNIEQIDKKKGFLVDKPLVFNNKEIKDFDLIIGNPPFNKGTILRKQTRKIKEKIKELGLEDTKRESLWTKFIINIFNKNLLKKDGYLLFITPINWFHPETTGVRDIMLSKQIEVVRIFSLYNSKDMFGGKGKLATAFYLIKNMSSKKETKIIDITQNTESVQLNKNSIIILAYNSIYNKILLKSDLFMNTDTLKSSTVKSCKPGPHKQIIGIYNNGDIKYVKTEEKHPLENTPKIIINGYTYPRYFYDKDGEYGKFSKDGTNFIIEGDNLDKVKKYFDTKLSALILNYIKFTQEKIEPKYFPDVRTLSLDKINDETLADYFGFTKEEREAINATEYPKIEYKFKEITCSELKKDKVSEGGAPTSRFIQTRKNRKH